MPGWGYIAPPTPATPSEPEPAYKMLARAALAASQRPLEGDLFANPDVPAGAISMGGMVAMVSPSGETGSIPEGHVKDALAAGFRLASATENRQALLYQEHGDTPGTAFAGAAASAATLGLVDLLRGRSAAGAEALAAERQYNPGASAAGTIAGILSPIGAGGAIGALGRGAGEAVAGTSAVRGLMAGSEGAQVLGRALVAGTGAATEGALLGAQQTVSKIALSADPLNAEAIAASLGTNMLFGGLAGGTAGAGLSALGSLARAAAVRSRNAVSTAVADEAAAPAVAIPQDIASLDIAGVKAARQAELERLTGEQVAARAAIGKDVLAFRQDLRAGAKDVPTLLKQTGQEGQGFARELIQSERKLNNIVDSLPESPAQGLTALRQTERAIQQAKDALGDAGAGLEPLAQQAAALKTRLEANVKTPTSDLLGQLEARLDQLKYPTQSAGASMTGHLMDMATGAAMHAMGPLGFLAPLARAGLGNMSKRLAFTTREFASTMTDLLDAATTGVSLTAPTLSRAVSQGIAFSAVQANNPDLRQEPEPVAKVAQDVLAAAANPTATRQRIEDSLTGIRAIDATLADQLTQHALTRLSVLANAAPKNPGMGSIGQDRWQPGSGELSKFAQVAAAVEQPLRILAHLASDTLTPTIVDAVKTVYPETFKRIGTEILDRLTAPGRATLSTARKLGISMITGSPIDSRLQPRAIGTSQQEWAQWRLELQQQSRAPRPQLPSQSRRARALTDLEPTDAQAPLGE